jgi:hypothetical protein
MKKERRRTQREEQAGRMDGTEAMAMIQAKAMDAAVVLEAGTKAREAGGRHHRRNHCEVLPSETARANNVLPPRRPRLILP